jgi:hypothetical protein
MFQNLISRYGSRLHNFWYEAQKKAKQNRERSGSPRLERCGGLEGLQTDIHPGRYMSTLS